VAVAQHSSQHSPAAGRLRPVARASRLVAAMKMLLPALAITLVALVLIWPQIGRNTADIPVDQAPVTLEDVDTLRMANPRFVGLDENDQPFEIVARAATQIGDTGQAVELDHPQADMVNKDGTWVSLNSEEGVWFKDASVVNLTGGVALFHDAGHQLVTEEAMIDMGPGNVFSEVPTQGQSPGGTIQGEGMQSLDRGARIIFTGKARAVLYSTGSSE
jgi:lipopolysaccharide export system protein LptC